MSRLWPDKVSIGLCPGRLVVATRGRPFGPWRCLTREVQGDPSAALAPLAHGARVSVVLSSHYVRYAVLPWSDALRSKGDWDRYAAHVFSSTYGPSASAWEIRACSTGHRMARVACAVDRELVERLRAIPEVMSVRPYFVAAFNARRRLLAGKSTWFAVHEPGRVAYGLIADDGWRVVRTRQIDGEWRGALLAALAREAAGLAGPLPKEVALCSEEQAAIEDAEYSVTDMSLTVRMPPDSRAHLMALH